MLITNYVDAGKYFYTNYVSNRYILENDQFVNVSNIVGKYHSSLDKSNAMFKVNGEDIIITLTLSKNYKRYGRNELLSVKTNGLEIINGVIVPKFKEVESIDIREFMKYWNDNKDMIREKKGKILGDSR